MQRKQGSRPHSRFRLVPLLFYLARFRLPAIILGGLLVVLAAAAGLFSCAYHPLMAVRGTMLFLPGV